MDCPQKKIACCGEVAVGGGLTATEKKEVLSLYFSTNFNLTRWQLTRERQDKDPWDLWPGAKV